MLNKLRKWILTWLFGHENMDFIADYFRLMHQSNKLITAIHRDYCEISNDQIAILQAVSANFNKLFFA